jgi:excisionase family DNA binding protein
VRAGTEELSHLQKGTEYMRDRLLSIDQVAKELGGLSRWTVVAWLRDGRLRRTKVGRRTLIRESELRRVIKEDNVGRIANREPDQKALSGAGGGENARRQRQVHLEVGRRKADPCCPHRSLSSHSG